MECAGPSGWTDEEEKILPIQFVQVQKKRIVRIFGLWMMTGESKSRRYEWDREILMRVGETAEDRGGEDEEKPRKIAEDRGGEDEEKPRKIAEEKMKAEKRVMRVENSH